MESGKAVEHFLGIVHAHEVNAEALTCYIFAHVSRNLFEYRKFDGSSTLLTIFITLLMPRPLAFLRYYVHTNLWLVCTCFAMYFTQLLNFKEAFSLKSLILQLFQ